MPNCIVYFTFFSSVEMPDSIIQSFLDSPFEFEDFVFWWRTCQGLFWDHINPDVNETVRIGPWSQADRANANKIHPLLCASIIHIYKQYCQPFVVMQLSLLSQILDLPKSKSIKTSLLSIT